MTSAKNKHGVYEDHDDYRLMDSRARISLAEVRVADTGSGWRARACFSFTTGNWWGSSGPITDRDPPFAAKEQAVAHAAAELFAQLSAAPSHAIEASMEPQHRKILAWLTSLAIAAPERKPEQMELFA